MGHYKAGTSVHIRWSTDNKCYAGRIVAYIHRRSPNSKGLYRVVYYSDEAFSFEDVDVTDAERRVHKASDPHLATRFLLRTPALNLEGRIIRFTENALNAPNNSVRGACSGPTPLPVCANYLHRTAFSVLAE